MKKGVAIIVLIGMLSVALQGCGGSAPNPAGSGSSVASGSSVVEPEVTVTAKCSNGNFVGLVENGVQTFKGIPYAKAPVGDRRWKAPEAPDDSDETFDAKEFGNNSIQRTRGGEAIGEDCLYLNVWTKDIEEKGKPVMLYIHGGAFTGGSGSDPRTDGTNTVLDNDVMTVTINYRLGLLGMLDLSKVPGGEEYPDAQWLSFLDIIQAIKWVKQNAEAFGGDPENITVYGESVGGIWVALLMSSKETEGLFQHAISESGSVNITYTQEEYDETGATEAVLKRTGAKTMDDLIAISEEDWIKYYTEPGEDGVLLSDITNRPLRGGNSPIPEDPYQAVLDGVNKDVDYITGTNKDEQRSGVTTGVRTPLEDLTDEEFEMAKAGFEAFWINPNFDIVMSTATPEEQEIIKGVMASCGEDEELLQKVEIYNEAVARMPAIVLAYNHAMAGGNTYMYFWEKGSTINDWIGACHAIEVPYVFNNPDTARHGPIDEELAAHVNEAWANFAKTGDPSTEFATWTKYEPDNRNTMIVGDDGSMKMESDPKKEQRELLEFLAYYYFK